ncbi:hypothetical protein ACFGVS_26115 [Mucilaginibacter sp. AW1-7]|uniref:hypothetical protein n=1 Tax=Mucilaginibacter sp. AW1-7 TaxID=3349874 RepID=UPI003F737D07
MKKTFPILSLLAVMAITGCSKKDKVTPVTSHALTFTTNASGYKTVISLQASGTAAESAKVLTSVTNNGTSFTYNTTISTGDHLLISISPDGAKGAYHYQIDDNATKADDGDVNVTAGTSLVLHYPKN